VAVDAEVEVGCQDDFVSGPGEALGGHGRWLRMGLV
jgi:hypothetical protein